MSDKITLDEIVAELRSGVTTICFEKLDGTLRTMNATLSEELLGPSDYKKSNDVSEKREITALPVWDVDVAGWRSFCLDRLKSINSKKVTYGS